MYEYAIYMYFHSYDGRQEDNNERESMAFAGSLQACTSLSRALQKDMVKRVIILNCESQCSYTLFYTCGSYIILHILTGLNDIYV